MQFRLTYEGRLYASRVVDSLARAKHKQDIRKVFHRQLKRLWQKTPHLGKVYEKGLWTPLPDSPLCEPVPPGWSLAEDLARRFSCGPYRIAPLVTEELSLVCGLEILLLRPGRAGEILSSGDIDNRVKTLIDALRKPDDAKELGGHTPEDGEDPFYCLLQDDNLISQLVVETDELWEPIGSSIDMNDARVVITVRIRPAQVKFANLSFA